MKKTLFKFLSCSMMVAATLFQSCDEPVKQPPPPNPAEQKEKERAEKIRLADSIAMTRYPLNCYPAGCVTDTPCSDSCIIAIADCHIIHDTIFNKMVDTFSKVGRRYTKDSIEKLLTDAVGPNGKCQDFWIEVNGAHSGPDSVHNRDITFKVKPMPAQWKRRATPRKYTTSLFMGLLKQGLTRVEFFKALKLNCPEQNGRCDDIIFKATFSNGKTVSYDISDSPPVVE